MNIPYPISLSMRVGLGREWMRVCNNGIINNMRMRKQGRTYPVSNK
ncbi:MAG TPA: hypothetical protein PLJ82_03700 [Paludibacteraceae bacterium]|nr:hypothetical protein [Paludibacteraceae bacterium]